jgi:hypothetical protein
MLPYSVIISECAWRSDVSSVCSIERCNENIKAGTTGGQEILTNILVIF